MLLLISLHHAFRSNANIFSVASPLLNKYLRKPVNNKRQKKISIVDNFFLALEEEED